jgi:DNA-binding transcriptional ArsR family regulator
MVNSPFRALSHPIRREIVERLATGPAAVGEITGDLGVSKPAISKHLKVLEETGVVSRVIEGRTHVLSLETAVLDEATEWMVRQRAFWDPHVRRGRRSPEGGEEMNLPPIVSPGE